MGVKLQLKKGRDDMKKITVIYWSGTGNTEIMANAIAESAKKDDVEVKLLKVADASIRDVEEADVVVLGCPSMGSEVLEEEEMAPFIESIESASKDKSVILFGSYGWGSGEWMENWEEQMIGYGSKLIAESLIINEEPDEEGLNQCYKLGQSL